MEINKINPLTLLQIVIGILLFLGLMSASLGISIEIIYINTDKNPSWLDMLVILSLLPMTGFSGSIVGSLCPKRVRRLVYIPLMAFLLPIFSISIIMFLGNYKTLSYDGYKYSLILWWMVNIVLIFSILELISSRLQDVNAHHSISVLFFIPIINLILIIGLCFMQGTIGVNQYGEDPRLKGIPPNPTP